ncbi:MAG: hypothetical protein Q8Q89_03580 [bacterium]|nr:hypothetical protein [bacterium]
MNKTSKISILLVVALMASGFGLVINAQTALSITTGQVVFVAARNVFLNATVNPNGNNTNVWFQIGTVQPPAGTRGYQGVGNRTSSINVQAGVINLLLDTTYYYRAIAQSSGNVVFGDIKSFRTPVSNEAYSSGGPGSATNNSNSNSSSNSNTSSNGGNVGSPLVDTNGPVSVSISSAVINGSINPNNAQTNFWFEFGVDQSLGQKTTVQSLGSVNSWQLVTGNLFGLESNRTYSYRVVAQNSQGTSFGGIRNFTTVVTSQNNQTSGGQVLGSVTNSPITPKTTGSSNAQTNLNSQTNLRPSFISLEYSLSNDGALVVVADNLKPRPGEQFSYTIVYKNDTQYSFNEAGLKAIIPSEADYINASIEPSRISGNMVEFALGNISPDSQGALTITARVKETTEPGTNMVFTSVLSYKDRFGVQLATTSYLTIVVGDAETVPLSASLISFWGGSGALLSTVIGFLAVFGLLVYGFVKTRNGKKNGKSDKEENGFSFNGENGNGEVRLKGVPPVFMPINGDRTK